MIHSSFYDLTIGGGLIDIQSYRYYNFIYGFLHTIFMQVAVPLFFFISGYLFFCKINTFGLKEYEGKLKNRAKTLLVPYIFWNFAMIAIMYLGQILLPGLLSGNNMMINDYGVKDWLMSFWDISYRTGGKEHLPMNGALWFIRDLMVIMLFSPLVWLIVKYLRRLGVAVFMLAWIFGWTGPFTGLSATAIFFFIAGAWFGINKITFVRDFKYKWLIIAWVGYIVVAIVLNLYKESFPWIQYINNLIIIVGCVLITEISALLIKKGYCRPNLFLARSSFFLFAYHIPVVAFCKNVLWKVCAPDCDFDVIGLYFLCVFLTIGIGLSLYWGLNKILPKFTSFITGGR